MSLFIRFLICASYSTLSLAVLVLDQIIEWLYNSVVGFLGDFFALMGQMGAELFDLPWVEAVLLFFGNFAWALYITGIVVAGFECAMEAQNGRGDIKATALNVLKGLPSTRTMST